MLQEFFLITLKERAGDVGQWKERGLMGVRPWVQSPAEGGGERRAGEMQFPNFQERGKAWGEGRCSAELPP